MTVSRRCVNPATVGLVEIAVRFPVWPWLMCFEFEREKFHPATSVQRDANRAVDAKSAASILLRIAAYPPRAP